MKDELEGKKIKELAALRVETYSYLTNNDEDKKAKGTTKCDLKRKLKFEEYDPVQKQFNLKTNLTIQKKNNLNVNNLEKNHKEFIKTNIKNTTKIQK